jgi:hypothetical protein
MNHFSSGHVDIELTGRFSVIVLVSLFFLLFLTLAQAGGGMNLFGDSFNL